MASISDLITRTCLVWTTERPLVKKPRKSQTFNLLNTQCYLEVSCYCNQYSLYLHHSSSELYGMVVTVHYENRKGRALPLSNRVIMTQQTFDIWKCTKFDIVKVIPNFFEDNQMIFVVAIDEDAKYRNVLQRTLTLRDETEFTISELKHVKTEEKGTQTCIYPDVNACLQNLSSDLSNMLDIDSDCDVQLKCGDRILKAHSVVLGTRSQVFKAMLQRNMPEVWTGVVNIHNMDFELLEHFIRYLYTGKLPKLTLEIATRLYEAGYSYGVKELSKQCSGFLTQHLMPENACKMLILADAHNDLKFKDYVVSYILDKNIIMQDDQWLPFCDCRPKLALQVFNRSRKMPQ